MISIIVCHRNEFNLSKLKKSLEKTVGMPYELVVIDNKENKHSLCSAYNEGVKQAKFDYVVFMHEDIRFITKNWGQIVIDLLKKNDVVGVAGTNYLADSGIWWAPRASKFLKGHIANWEGKNIKKTIFSEDDGKVVVLDGVFIATKKKIAEEIKFDEKTFDGFHFYEIDWTLRVSKKYRLLATTKILILHESIGDVRKNDDWKKYREKFIEKHKSILPYAITNEIPNQDYLEKTKEIIGVK